MESCRATTDQTPELVPVGVPGEKQASCRVTTDQTPELVPVGVPGGSRRTRAQESVTNSVTNGSTNN